MSSRLYQVLLNGTHYRVSLNGSIDTMEAFEGAINNRIGRHYTARSELVPEIKTYHYRVEDCTGIFELLMDEDINTFNGERKVIEVILNYVPRKERVEVKEENDNNYNRPSEMSNVSGIAAQLNQVKLTEKLLAKSAIDINVKFSGNNNTLSLVVFQEEIMYHMKNYDVEYEVIYKLLMGGNIILNPAREILKENIELIVVAGGDEDDDDKWKKRLDAVFVILGKHYANVDMVFVFRNKLYALAQGGMSTAEYLNAWKREKRKLLLEIAYRNKLAGKTLHVIPTDFELAGKLRNGLDHRALKWFVSKSLEKHNSMDINLENTFEIITAYILEENAILNVVGQNRNKLKLFDKKQVSIIDQKQEFRSDYKRLVVRDNNNNKRNETKLCYNGTESMCRKIRNNCNFRHCSSMEEWTAYRAKCANQDCVFGTNCKRRGCLFNHRHKGRDNSNRGGGGKGDKSCRYGWKCRRKECRFEHPNGRAIDNKEDKSSKYIEVGGHHNVNEIEVKEEEAFNIDDIGDIYGMTEGAMRKLLIMQQRQQQKEINLVSFEKNEQQKSFENDIECKSIKYGVNSNDKTSSQYEINQIVKLNENDKRILYALQHGRNNLYDDLLHRMLTPLKSTKPTITVKIWDEAGWEMNLFIDSGADINILEGTFDAVFKGKYRTPTRKKIKAVAMDHNDTQKTYTLNIRHRIPVEHIGFNYDTGHDILEKRELDFWQYDGLKPGSMIIGRPGIKALGLALLSTDNMKRLMYYQKKGEDISILQKDEDLNILFDRLEYRNGNEPGLRRIDYNNNTIELVDNMLINKENEILLVDVYEEQTVDKMNKRLEDTQMVQINMTEQVKLKEIAEQLRKEKTDQELLDCISCGDDMNEEEKQWIMDQIKKYELLEVISRNNWDMGTMQNIDPFKVLIKDPMICRVMPPYDKDMSDVDQKAYWQEIGYLIIKGRARWVTQNDKVIHASPGFIVHHEVAEIDQKVKLVKSRLAVDYTELNRNTYKLNINLGITLDELLRKLGNYRYFNYFDFAKYFYSILAEEESQNYLNLSTSRGVIRILTMPTGVKNAPLYAQKITADAFEGTDVIPLQDDCFGGGITKRECMENFIEALKICKKMGLKISTKSIGCCMNEVDAAGYKVNTKGVIPLPRNTTKALRVDIKRLTSYKEWVSFRGMLEFLNGYLNNLNITMAKITRDIIDPAELDKIKKSTCSVAIKRKMRDKIKLKWTEEARNRVKLINVQLENIPLLYHVITTSDGGPIIVKVDASLYGIGGTLWQLRVTYYVLCLIKSKMLSLTQRNYSASERECLGVITALSWYSKYLRGRVFTLICDHQPLEALFNVSLSTKNYKLTRMRALVSQYELVFDYQPGNGLTMKLEDALSRITEPTENKNDFKENGIRVPVDTEDVMDIKRLNDAKHNEEEKVDINFIEELRKLYEIQLISIETVDDYDMEQIQINKFEKIESLDNKQSLEIKNELFPSLNLEYDDKGLFVNYNYMHNHNAIDIIAAAKPPSVARKAKVIQSKMDENNIIKHISEIYRIQQQHDVLLDGKIVTDLDDDAYNGYLRDLQFFKYLNGAQLKLNDYKKFNNNDHEVLLQVKVRENGYGLSKDEISAINVWTRSMAKKYDEINNDEEKIEDIMVKRGYLLHPEEENVFVHKKGNDSLSILYEMQSKAYKNLRKYIVTGKQYYNRSSLKSMEDTDYYDFVQSGSLKVNEDGFICYNDGKYERYLIPMGARSSLVMYYHTNPSSGNHGSAERIYEAFMKRFYWKGMKNDINIIINSCPCKSAKLYKRRASNAGDIGPKGLYHAIRPNQYVFMDLWGPTESGNHVIVFIDGFDKLCKIRALKPLFSTKALGIVQASLFIWDYAEGCKERVIHDGGTNVDSKLNKLHSWVIGTVDKSVWAYCAWKNGYVEQENRTLNKAVLTENTRREIIKYRSICDRLKKLNVEKMTDKELNYVCYGLEVSENNKIDKIMGYSPYQLRRTTGSSILMDVNMKLEVIKRIKKDEYVVNNVVDFDKYYKLISMQSKILMNDAKAKKMNHLINKKKTNDEDALNGELIKLYDHVMIKVPWTSKKINNFKVGWVVTGIDHVRDKRKFDVTNIISNEKLEGIDQGKLVKIHEPVFVSTIKAMENEITRLMDLEKISVDKVSNRE